MKGKGGRGHRRRVLQNCVVLSTIPHLLTSVFDAVAGRCITRVRYIVQPLYCCGHFVWGGSD
jgi:hypothetical protein